MAGVKPILYKKNPIDARESSIFQYSYNGVIQKFNKLTIQDNSTGTIVFEEIKIVFPENLSYTLDANKLINGKDYNASITVYTGGTVTAPTGDNPPSEKIYFKCLAKPVFSITNLVNEQVIQNSSFSVEFSYSQANNELLDYFIVNLIDGNTGRIVKTSNNLYPNKDGSIPPYTIFSLLNKEKYKIDAIGKTVNGMNTSTQIVSFSVNYSTPSIYSQMYVENIPEQASVRIQSNYTAIEGSSNPTPPTYINNQEIDLTGKESWAKFNQGFIISDNFSTTLTCRNITNNNTPFFVLSVENSSADKNSKITVQKKRGIFNNVEQEYFVLFATSNHFNYRIVSNLVKVLTPQDKCKLKIIRENNIYDIKAEVVL